MPKWRANWGDSGFSPLAMAEPTKRTRQNHGDDRQSPRPKRISISALSAAAKFNVMAMRKLERALEHDPECDLAAALPPEYSSRLSSRKPTEGKGFLICIRNYY